MTARKGIFRQVALDRLSSPEQLDQLMQVTRPRSWIGLAALALVLAGALVWGVAGRISEKVPGRGILVKSGGIFHVAPARGGRVSDLAVAVGDSVVEGQIVARIAQPELSHRVVESRSRLERLEAEHRQMARFGGEDVRLQRRSHEQRREQLNRSIAAGRESLRWLEETARNQERLAEQGLITRQTLLNTRESLHRSEAQIRLDENRLTELRAEELQLDARAEREATERAFAIAEATRELEEAERNLHMNADVVAPYTGRVIEVLTEQGYLVNAGEPLLALHLTGRTVEDLQAIIYVPSNHGKNLQPGMPIHIAPATVRREEYGLMIGRVTYVSEFPATMRGMQRVLKNEALAATLAAGDAPYEVHAELIPDPTTPSRYRWTSSDGPPAMIQSGTLATAEITLDTSRPLDRALPVLRRYSQVDERP